MKRKIALCLLTAVLANPALAALDAASVTALKNAGVDDAKLNQIEASISADTPPLTNAELAKAMKDAGLTTQQMQTLSQLTAPTVATGGGASAGMTAGMTIAASVGLGIVIAAAALAIKDSVSNKKGNTSGTIVP